MKDSRLIPRIVAEIVGTGIGSLPGWLAGCYELALVGSVIGFFIGYSIVGEKIELSPPPPQSLAVQALGAVPWGLFFSVMPFMEVLFLLSPAWGTLLILRERARAKRNGFLRGALVRLAVVIAIVAAAVWAPVKDLDQTVGPLPPAITLQDLSRQYEVFHAYPHIPPGFNPTLSFPRKRMTRREVLQSVKEQTGLKWTIVFCGNDVTFLGGAYPMSVMLAPGVP
jgi:hypothetical protein